MARLNLGKLVTWICPNSISRFPRLSMMILKFHAWKKVIINSMIFNLRGSPELACLINIIILFSHCTIRTKWLKETRTYTSLHIYISLVHWHTQCVRPTRHYGCSYILSFINDLSFIYYRAIHRADSFILYKHVISYGPQLVYMYIYHVYNYIIDYNYIIGYKMSLHLAMYNVDFTASFFFLNKPILKSHLVLSSRCFWSLRIPD